MANYVRTPSNVQASIHARRVKASPDYVFRGSPPVPIPNVLLAGVAIQAGQPVYQGADNLIYLADADGADPLYKVIGLAENTAAFGQPVSVVEYDPDFIPGFTMAIGDVPIVSATAGELCDVADRATAWRVQVIGVAVSTTKLFLNLTRSDVPRA